MSRLVVSDLGVRIGANALLSGISFAAEPGQVTVIVGPNGSGKSTLLRALSGELPYSGQASLGDLEIAKTNPEILSEHRAVLPQATPLSFPFQVLEVVRLGMRFRADTVARQALIRVGLQGYEARFYQDLSGGEQQRTQLARVLCQLWSAGPASGPSWMFLDEPVSSLDIAHQLEVMQIARDFANAGGGVLAVMHDLNLSAMVADRVLVLKSGRIAADGPVAETLTEDLLSQVYDCAITTCQPPSSGQWYFLPQQAATMRRLPDLPG